MAPDRQGGRRRRSRTRRVRRQAEAGAARRRRESRCQVVVDRGGAAALITNRHSGRGMPADPTEGVKWHLIAKAGGAGDPELDVFVAKQKPELRDAAEKAVAKWLSTVAALRP